MGSRIGMATALAWLVLITGCGPILDANFEDSKYDDTDRSSVAGLIPGSPDGDRITVTGETIFIFANTAAIPNLNAVTGQKSMSFGFTAGIGHEVENGIAYFSSAPITSSNSKFTLFWAGKKVAKDSTIVCNVGGIDTGTDAKAAFRVSAGDTWTVVDASGSTILGNVTTNSDTQQAPVHNVDIDYYPGSGSFTVEIKQLDTPTFEFSGSVFQNTKAAIQETERIGLWCLKTSNDASILDVAYLMDGVIIREK